MEHSLGPACRLRPAPDADADADKEDGVPAVTAQFFYTAIYPIDDPLSGSASASGADSKPSKAPLRPFSHDDNDMLQQAWLGLSSESHRVQHADIRSGREPAPDAVKSDLEKRGLLVRKLASKHKRLHSEKKQTRKSTTEVAEAAIPETLLTACCPDLATDALTELDTAFCSLVRKTNRLFDVEEVVKDVTAVMNQSLQLQGAPSPRRQVPVRHPLLARERRAGLPSDGASIQRKAAGFVAADDHGITGKPFVRVPSTEQAPRTASSEQQQQQQQQHNDEPLSESSSQLNDVVIEADREIPVEQPIPVETTAPDLEDEDRDVVVGLARLHKVCLHTLQMKPVYWSPINDVAVVTRGTWFYKYVL